MKVAVCVCTHRRPDSLDRLLRSLADQRFDGEPPEVELVVVDNDDAGTGRPVVERWADRIGWPVRYAVEPERGIPHARNRALAEAPDDADVVAMVDDDDRPEAGWLDRLLAALERRGADVATGPQIPVYPEGVPAWIARGGFFEGRRRPTGDPVDNAYTHNVAFRTRVLEDPERRFDVGLAWQGHDDTDFFRRVELAGHEMVWVDEAVVLNPVPSERATARWLLRRFFRFGIGNAVVQRRHDEPLRRRLVRAGKMAGRLAVSPLRVLARLHEGRAALLRLAVDWVFPIGYLLGWFGFTYEEYRHHEYPEAGGSPDRIATAADG